MLKRRPKNEVSTRSVLLSASRRFFAAAAFSVAWAIVNLIIAFLIGSLLGYFKPLRLPDHIPHLRTVLRELAFFILFGSGLLTIAAPISAGATIALWWAARSTCSLAAKQIARFGDLKKFKLSHYLDLSALDRKRVDLAPERLLGQAQVVGRLLRQGELPGEFGPVE